MSHLKETLNLRWHHFLVTSLSKTRLQSYIKRWWFGSEVWKTKKTLDQNIFTTFKLPENIRIWPVMTELIKTNGPNSILPVSYYDFLKIFESKPLRNDNHFDNLHFYGGSKIRWVKQKFAETYKTLISLLLTPGESQVSSPGTLPSHFRAQKHLL